MKTVTYSKTYETDFHNLASELGKAAFKKLWENPYGSCYLVTIKGQIGVDVLHENEIESGKYQIEKQIKGNLTVEQMTAQLLESMRRLPIIIEPKGGTSV